MEDMWKSLDDEQFRYIKDQENERFRSRLGLWTFMIAFFAALIMGFTYESQCYDLEAKKNEIKIHSGPIVNDTAYYDDYNDLDADIRALMSDYDGTDSFSKIEEDDSDHYTAIYVMEVIAILLALTISYVLLYNNYSGFLNIDNLLIARGTCVGKERIRTRHRSSDYLDVRLEDGHVIYGYVVRSKVYDFVFSGDDVLVVKIKDSGETIDGVYPSIY